MKITIIEIIEESYRGYTIKLEQHNEHPWHVTIESPSYIFESCSLFLDENDALEYAKLMINKWHAERSIINGKNPQQ